MKVLHILKTEPDETVEELLAAFADDEATTVPLFEGDVDWADLVDEIFASDKVICWW
jgi:hypothetical protein